MISALRTHPHEPHLIKAQVGVGTSCLQLEMVQQGGFRDILNTDYSQVWGWRKERGRGIGC